MGICLMWNDSIVLLGYLCTARSYLVSSLIQGTPMKDFIKQMIKSHEEDMSTDDHYPLTQIWESGYLQALKDVLEGLESVDEDMVNDLAKKLES